MLVIDQTFSSTGVILKETLPFKHYVLMSPYIVKLGLTCYVNVRCFMAGLAVMVLDKKDFACISIYWLLL